MSSCELMQSDLVSVADNGGGVSSQEHVVDMTSSSALSSQSELICTQVCSCLPGFNITTGELGYDGPLYDGFLHMTDVMLGPSPMHSKCSSCVYDGFCI